METFRFESDLVKKFCDSLDSSGIWSEALVLREFDYQSGRTDVVLSHGKSIVAIEAKLLKWKKALLQAYRNTCFADLSFVLLPEGSAKMAFPHLPEFEKRGIGLLSISVSGKIRVLIQAEKKPPVLKALKATAKQLVLDANAV